MDSVWLKLFCSFFCCRLMRSQIPTPQLMTSHLTAHISALTGACVPPCVPLVTKSLAWPGGWRTLATSCARLDRAAQPSVSLTSLILGPAHRPAESPEPELCPGSSPPSLSLSLSLHPRYKATLEPGPSHPPPPGSPGSPRIFTFKSPIHRFAFKCFFSATSRLTDYLHTAGHQLIFNSFSLIWENILLTALTILTGVGHCNTHHSDTPGWGSIQMVEDENKKSFNDCFDLQKNWKDESSVVKLH